MVKKGNRPLMAKRETPWVSGRAGGAITVQKVDSVPERFKGRACEAREIFLWRVPSGKPRKILKQAEGRLSLLPYIVSAGEGRNQGTEWKESERAALACGGGLRSQYIGMDGVLEED